jgi:hypothetical protein
MKEKISVRSVYKKILALLAAPIILTGCGKQEDCDIKAKHVHKFIQDTEKGRIVTLIDSHESNYHNFHWTNGYVEIKDDYDNFYKTKDTLFRGDENWDYLYNLMSDNKDYIEYHYDYHKRRVVTTSSAQTLTYPVQQRHAGWTTDSTHEGLDGKVKLHHYQYNKYQIYYKDGKYRKKKSPLVDDIRDIINEYPYFSIDCFEIIEKEYEFDKDNVSKVTINDINEYQTPDLNNKEIHK